MTDKNIMGQWCFSTLAANMIYIVFLWQILPKWKLSQLSRLGILAVLML